jgi:succinate dehydrogenase/fumarate reductase flavoprotein subunit
MAFLCWKGPILSYGVLGSTGVDVEIRRDFLVIGTGLAGLSFALRAAAHGTVALVTKRSADESNTVYAQGGIAGVLHPADTVAAHVADTLIAGAGLCREEVVRAVVQDSSARIADLIDVGVAFSRRPERAGTPPAGSPTPKTPRGARSSVLCWRPFAPTPTSSSSSTTSRSMW